MLIFKHHYLRQALGFGMGHWANCDLRGAATEKPLGKPLSGSSRGFTRIAVSFLTAALIRLECLTAEQLAGLDLPVVAHLSGYFAAWVVVVGGTGTDYMLLIKQVADVDGKVGAFDDLVV
ncbi:hypothetical protein SAMN05216264_107150 [Pseudomonas marincola]|nr:hypothetical protein SAMN05216264_107150 [Pseudomonas marincola]